MSCFSLMSRIEFERNYPDMHREVCEKLGIGFVPNLFRCFAELRPELAQSSWNLMRSNLCEGNLPRITKELIFSYVAHRKQCNYCHVAHHALAIKQGFSGEDIQIVMENLNQIKNPVLRTVIQFTDLCVNNHFTKIESFYNSIRELGFSDDDLGELMGMISCALYMVNLANSVTVDVDEAFMTIIKQAS